MAKMCTIDEWSSIRCLKARASCALAQRQSAGVFVGLWVPSILAAGGFGCRRLSDGRDQNAMTALDVQGSPSRRSSWPR
jgi:hypothetical protein